MLPPLPETTILQDLTACHIHLFYHSPKVKLSTFPRGDGEGRQQSRQSWAWAQSLHLRPGSCTPRKGGCLPVKGKVSVPRRLGAESEHRVLTCACQRASIKAKLLSVRPALLTSPCCQVQNSDLSLLPQGLLGGQASWEPILFPPALRRRSGKICHIPKDKQIP